MHIVGLAWIFVVVLMAAAEATSPQGSLLGAVFTLLLYGLLPLSIVLYILATPARRRARRARDEADEAMAALEAAPTGESAPGPVEAATNTATAAAPAAAPVVAQVLAPAPTASAASATQRDARGQAPGDGLPPV